MKNKKIKNYSQLSNRTVAWYITSCLVLLLLLLGGFYLAWLICSQFTWYKEELLYIFLKTLEALSPFIIIFSLLIGFFVLAIITIKRPFQYLNSMVDAAKSLSHPDNIPIELPEELADIQNELNLARVQALQNIDLANEAVQRKNDLIMYLAHDLKTPLASVIGYLNLLRDEQQISDELREKYLSITLDKAERLEELINEFFEIARFNLSNITLQYSSINLARLLEQLIFEFQPMLKEKNLTCNLHIAEEEQIRCDADKIQRVFDNLLKNAILYSFEDSVIEITVVKQGNFFIIRFINCGDTIPKEKLERIFEQFYRLDASRGTRSGGAGLGLAIAKQIVELHGGTITAKSERENIEFTVVLPDS